MYNLENDPIPEFNQINSRNCMLIYTEKEAQLIAEPTDGMFTLHQSLVSFLLHAYTSGEFLKLSNIHQAFQVHLLFCVLWLLFFSLYITKKKKKLFKLLMKGACYNVLSSKNICKGKKLYGTSETNVIANHAEIVRHTYYHHSLGYKTFLLMEKCR